MAKLAQLNKKLKQQFNGAVTAAVQDDYLKLTGQLEHWDDIVSAGYLAAKNNPCKTVVNHIEWTGGIREPMRLPDVNDTSLDESQCDVLVIGAGVTGCAIARELARYHLDILLVEKEYDVALHASSRNDGMVHPGIDLRLGSEKQRYNAIGNAMYDELCRDLGVDFKRWGQYLCFSGSVLPLLYLTVPYWHRKGLEVQVLNRRQLHKAEPGLDPSLGCALFFPSAGSVCPYGLTIALAENAVENGVRLSLNTAVLGMILENGVIKEVKTNRGTIHPKLVINAAGVFADEIARQAGDEFYTIHPRRGTNSITDKKFSDQIVHTIASTIGTSTTHTKGGGIVRTVDNNLLVGPDAQETPERENFDTSAASIAATFTKQHHTSPQLQRSRIITYFTGVRAATYEEDFVVCAGKKTSNLIHAAGIQSPGLTAAPAIGLEVARMAAKMLNEKSPVVMNGEFNPVRKPIPRPSALPPNERDELIQQNPDYGFIVCRCEEVSRGEILDALHRPVPCNTVDGVKRRVRPGMGRCQGGFCGPLVAQIIAEEKLMPLDMVCKGASGSYLVCGDTKDPSELVSEPGGEQP